MNSLNTVVSDIDTDQKQAFRLFGDLFLGVVCNPEPNNDATMISEEGRNKPIIKLYSWMTGKVIGMDIPSPNAVVWDPREKFCLLIYKNDFCLFSCRPSFRKIVQHELRNIKSALWFNETLFLATEVDVFAVFPHEKSKLLKPMEVASLRESKIQGESNRPLGAVSLVTVVEKQLINESGTY